MSPTGPDKRGQRPRSDSKPPGKSTGMSPGKSAGKAVSFGKPGGFGKSSTFGRRRDDDADVERAPRPKSSSGRAPYGKGPADRPARSRDDAGGERTPRAKGSTSSSGRAPYGKGPGNKPARGRDDARPGPVKRKTPAKPVLKSATPKAPGLVRLNKFLADRGVDSRRKCDELIADGKVTVNEVTVTELGIQIDTTKDTVEVAGFVFRPDEQVRKRYYVLNKPPGVVCTNERRELRPKAVDLITDRQKGRIYTVGRLDEESKGLVILTNDGEFAHHVMHPRFAVPKTYAVKVRGPVDDEALQKVREGVYLAEGRTGGARVVVNKRTRDYTHLLITLHEGKNREVRRILARVGAKVAELKRVRIGNLTDKGLKVGTWRPLLRAEVQDMIELAEGRGRAPETDDYEASDDGDERPARSSEPRRTSAREGGAKPYTPRAGRQSTSSVGRSSGPRTDGPGGARRKPFTAKPFSASKPGGKSAGVRKERPDPGARRGKGRQERGR